MTQLKLCTLVGVANLLLEVSPELMMYKIQHQLLDIDRDLYLIPGDSRTRGQHRFFQERSNYDTLRNSFQRTAREWNHLPDTTVGASSIEEFRLATPTSVNSFNCVIIGPLLEEPMLTSGSAVTRSEV
jgi:hypothetical protein